MSRPRRPTDQESFLETTRVPRFLDVGVTELIGAGQIGIAYQPIVDLETGETFAFEVLVRPSHPEVSTPGVLLTAAEQQSVLGALGRHIRELGVARCPHSRLFFNIHPAEFDEEFLIQGDDPVCLHEREVFLEITESVPLSHYRFCGAILKELRARGVKLAIDDFGAGYSNLKYITDLKPDIVKLDRQFVEGVRVGSREQILIASLAELCRAQGAIILAEGIETAEELAAIRGAGVKYAQGYVIARPGPTAVERNWSALWR